MVQDEMHKTEGFVWDVHVGFHAVPSMVWVGLGWIWQVVAVEHDANWFTWFCPMMIDIYMSMWSRETLSRSDSGIKSTTTPFDLTWAFLYTSMMLSHESSKVTGQWVSCFDCPSVYKGTKTSYIIHSCLGQSKSIMQCWGRTFVVLDAKKHSRTCRCWKLI